MTSTSHSFIDGVRRSRLPNGLTFLMREDHGVPIVTSMIWYKVGSRYESPGCTGMSHFLEHMMFKGTSRYQKGEIDYLTMRQGGNSNAFTSHDYTAYYFSFASDRWWQALEIEADRMRNNLFEAEEFELEKQVIIEELKMDLDTPWGALRHAVEFQSFERHPYKYPVIGLHEDLAALTLERMIEFYNRFYLPNNAILVMAGDFKTEEAMKRVEELFGPIEAGEVPQVSTQPERRQPPPKRLEIKKPSHVSRMLLTFSAPSVRETDHYAMQLVDKILSQGKLSRFYQRLVERERIASLVSAEFGETFDPYLFFVRVELQENVSAARAEDVIFQEVESLAGQLPSEQEMLRAKNLCITEFLEDFETTLGQAAQLGLMETLDRYEYWLTYADRIRSVTTEEVRDVARRYLSPQQATIGIALHGATEQIPVSADQSE